MQCHTPQYPSWRERPSGGQEKGPGGGGGEGESEEELTAGCKFVSM